MMKLNLTQLQELMRAIDYVVGYETDTSCGDPECCGGPYFDRDDYQEELEVLKQFGITYEDA